MSLDAIRAGARRVSLSTWGALGAVVVALGSLGLFLMGCDFVWRLDHWDQPVYPNYYTCNCGCSRRVVTTGANVFLLAGSNFLGTAPAGSEGAILDGPVDALLNGTPETWWQVHFDIGSALEGWVTQNTISAANTTSISKSGAQACVPPSLNQNLQGGHAPSIDELKTFCAADVALTAQTSVNQKLASLGKFFCQCAAETTQFTSM